MKRELRDRGNRLLAGLFLLILSAYYVNSTMCYHQHEIQGETIFHSHFYSDNHTKTDDGGHSVDIVKLIASLSNIALEEQHFAGEIGGVVAPLEVIYIVEATALAHSDIGGHYGLRAPPVL